MNWDRNEGNWKQVKERIKEKWGKLTDDELDVRRSSWLTAVSVAAVFGLAVSPVVAQVPVEPPPLPDPLELRAPDVQVPDANITGKAKAQAEGQTEADANVQVDIEGEANADTRPALDGGRESQIEAEAGAQNRGQIETDLEDRARVAAHERIHLGVEFESEQGRLTINQVTQESAAARAGLRAGDELVAIDGQRISTQAELNGRLNARRGGPTTIHYWRDGSLREAQLDLSNAADADGRVGTFYRGPESAPPLPPEGAVYEGSRVESYNGYDYRPRRYYRSRRGCWWR